MTANSTRNLLGVAFATSRLISTCAICYASFHCLSQYISIGVQVLRIDVLHLPAFAIDRTPRVCANWKVSSSNLEPEVERRDIGVV